MQEWTDGNGITGILGSSLNSTPIYKQELWTNSGRMGNRLQGARCHPQVALTLIINPAASIVSPFFPGLFRELLSLAREVKF